MFHPEKREAQLSLQQNHPEAPPRLGQGLGLVVKVLEINGAVTLEHLSAEPFEVTPHQCSVIVTGAQLHVKNLISIDHLKCTVSPASFCPMAIQKNTRENGFK